MTSHPLSHTPASHSGYVRTAAKPSTAAVAGSSSRHVFDHIKPDEELVRYYQRRYKLYPDDDLRRDLAVAKHRVETFSEEVSHWPADTNRNTWINALSELTAVERELRHRAERDTRFQPIDYDIPRHVLDEIKAKSSIMLEIEQITPLAKRGRNYVGLCPFHEERTPSLTVFPDDHFHCFGCGVGGDVFTFVQAFNRGMSFAEAAYYLAARAGVDIPKPATTRTRRSTSIRSRGVNHGR